MKKLLVAALLTAACHHGVSSTPVPPPAPPPVVQPPATAPGLPAIHNDNGYFADSAGKPWTWVGTNSFLLLQQVLDGQDIDPLLRQYQDTGFNVVRVFGMCRNIADFNPAAYGERYWAGVDLLLHKAEDRGLYVELTVFADAALVMPNLAAQQAHWHGFTQFAGRANLFVELVNENNNFVQGQGAVNRINTDAFDPINGIMCAHGSNVSDAHPVDPPWNYVTYHARRDEAKAVTNYDSMEFESNFKDRPEIPDEGLKTTDVRIARLMGMHARISGGGTFHTQSGVASRLLNDGELAAAHAFVEAVR